jgi:integrase
VKAYKLTGGHKPWTTVQIAAAKRDLTGVVRRGIMLYLYTGQRGSDVVRLGPTYLDDGGFDLSFDRAQQKTRVEVWCPILPELAAEMENWSRRPGPYLVQESGAPYTRNLLMGWSGRVPAPPASEAGNGAPKTRSTPCLRHPIPRSP